MIPGVGKSVNYENVAKSKFNSYKTTFMEKLVDCRPAHGNSFAELAKNSFDTVYPIAIELEYIGN